MFQEVQSTVVFLVVFLVVVWAGLYVYSIETLVNAPQDRADNVAEFMRNNSIERWGNGAFDTVSAVLGGNDEAEDSLDDEE